MQRSHDLCKNLWGKTYGPERRNYPEGDICNCSDGEKAATDQITEGDDNLSNHPGVWDATAAAEQPHFWQKQCRGTTGSSRRKRTKKHISPSSFMISEPCSLLS
ncbi:uncharacterized protein LOC125579061 [Brassica napus]|uniref:uncharacterized protein LOC125579061 n=1 Tax=Brassica napus TaxID=3708 RepID=UPI0020785A2E|nr:uncharacterized protein LOC125579061 [Brassica napus]